MKGPKYKIILTDAQLDAVKVLLKTKRAILFEDTHVVCIDLDNYIYIEYQMLSAFEMMDILRWKRKIGREQHEFRLNKNTLSKVGNLNMHITNQNLLKDGYSEFPPHEAIDPYADKAYQKCIYDTGGEKAFFINFYHYPSIDEKGIKESWSSNTQLQLMHRDEKRTFNINYFIENDATVKEVEDFYSKVFRSLNCINYQH